MSCIITEMCNYRHCEDCPEYKIPCLTTRDDNSCEYCKEGNNNFVLLNQTYDYSGIEIALNGQGMLRVRYYIFDDYNWFSEDIINIKFCPVCGRRF